MHRRQWMRDIYVVYEVKGDKVIIVISSEEGQI